MSWLVIRKIQADDMDFHDLAVAENDHDRVTFTGPKALMLVESFCIWRNAMEEHEDTI